MDRNIYQATLHYGYLILKCVKGQNFSEALKAAQNAMDFGCFIDPTLWNQKFKELQQDLEVLRMLAKLEEFSTGIFGEGPAETCICDECEAMIPNDGAGCIYCETRPVKD